MKKSLCKVETEPVKMLLLNVGITVGIKFGCTSVYYIYTLSNFKIKKGIKTIFYKVKHIHFVSLMYIKVERQFY